MGYFTTDGALCVLVTWSHLTLCNPVDCSLQGSSVHGILQAKILEWVAISSPEDLPNPGTEPWSSALWEDSLPSEPPGSLRIYSILGYLVSASSELLCRPSLLFVPLPTLHIGSDTPELSQWRGAFLLSPTPCFLKVKANILKERRKPCGNVDRSVGFMKETDSGTSFYI